MDTPTYILGKRMFNCPIDLAVNAINGKWKLLILFKISEANSIRFGELKRLIAVVSEKMLIQHLKELESDGLVIRQVYAVVPPKVEYSLSDTGKAFIPVIEAMHKCGSTFLQKESNPFLVTHASDNY